MTRAASDQSSECPERRYPEQLVSRSTSVWSSECPEQRVTESTGPPREHDGESFTRASLSREAASGVGWWSALGRLAGWTLSRLRGSREAFPRPSNVAGFELHAEVCTSLWRSGWPAYLGEGHLVDLDFFQGGPDFRAAIVQASSVHSNECPGQRVSRAASAQSSKCPERRVSRVASLRSSECPEQRMSRAASVQVSESRAASVQSSECPEERVFRTTGVQQRVPGSRCPEQLVSRAASAHSGKFPEQRVTRAASVQSDECPEQRVSGATSVQSSECPE
jgi:predicted metal-binding protein